MRATLAALLLVAIAGCKSQGERPDRDYTSVNRSSVDFVFETLREGKRMRKQNLKQTLAFSRRAPQNRRLRKESAHYALETFWMDEPSGFRRIWDRLKLQRKPEGERMRQIRFGLLDSGE